MSMLRGTTLQVPNRFETRSVEAFDDGWGESGSLELPMLQTEFLSDHSKSILAKNDSPDLGFTYSINVYRGCEHGCSYCYARPTHEYLGFNSGIDFESKIMVKHDAPALLRRTFDARSWQPQFIMMSGNTDCYQPAERKFQITRQVLEVLLEYRNPVGIITKNALVVRDRDLLTELASLNLVGVFFSITTLNRELARKLEPRTATPERRLAAMEKLTKAGIPCGVMMGPVIPGLNDEEMLPILKAASESGAVHAGYNMLRVPYGVLPIFKEWLEREVPLEAKKVLARVEMVRDGKLNDVDFGSRMRGTGAYADYIKRTFRVGMKRYGLDQQKLNLTTEHFRRAGKLTLFD
jgi:DNA repair photolyase